MKRDKRKMKEKTYRKYIAGIWFLTAVILAGAIGLIGWSVWGKYRDAVIEKQEEIIRQHTETLAKLTEILDNQNKNVQEIKKMVSEQAEMLSEQKVNMNRLFQHTAELAQKLDDACGTDTALVNGVAALLRDRIKQAHKYYKDKGGISPTGLENIEAIYVVYHDQLHQNGVGEKMYNEIKALPIRNEETF